MKIKYLILVVIWCSIIFAFSASHFYTGENTLTLFQNYLGVDYDQAAIFNAVARKVAHVCIFGMLSVFLYLFLKRRLLLSWGLCTLYAITDEYHQSFIPGRTSSVLDVLLDSSAAMLFLLIARNSMIKKQVQKGNRVRFNV